MATRRQSGAGVSEELANQPPAVRASLEKASRQGGAAVGDGLAAAKNQGAGEVRVRTNDKEGINSLAQTIGTNFLQDENGNLAAILNGDIKFFNTEGKEIKVGGTVAAMVTDNGFVVKNLDSAGRYMPPKGKAELTPAQNLAVLDAWWSQQSAGNAATKASLGQYANADGTFNVPANILPASLNPANTFDIKPLTPAQKKERNALIAKAKELGIEGLAEG